MTQDERTLIRQVELWARFNQEVCQFSLTEYREDVKRGRPFFIIDTAMHGCGYVPCGRDWPKWGTIKRWMDKRKLSSGRSGPIKNCEDPNCAERR